MFPKKNLAFVVFDRETRSIAVLEVFKKLLRDTFANIEECL